MTITGDKDLFGCGAATIGGISYDSGNGAPGFVKKILTHKTKYVFYVMADAQPKDPEQTFMIRVQKYIEKENLGPMIESEGWHYNEAHGPRYIKIYVWRPDYKVGAAWLEKNKDVKAIGDSMW